MGPCVHTLAPHGEYNGLICVAAAMRPVATFNIATLTRA